MINVGAEQDLQLDPGNYSLDLDGKSFNASVEVFSFRYDSISFLLGLDLQIFLSKLFDVESASQL